MPKTEAGHDQSHLPCRKDIYIALEEVNFIWSREEVEAFDLMWHTNIPLTIMEKFFKRDADEIALLAMDRMKREKIAQRERGIFG